MTTMTELDTQQPIEWHEEYSDQFYLLAAPEPLETVGDAIEGLDTVNEWLVAALDLLGPSDAQNPEVAFEIFSDARKLLVTLRDAISGERPCRLKSGRGDDPLKLFRVVEKILDCETDATGDRRVVAGQVVMRSAIAAFAAQGNGKLPSSAVMESEAEEAQPAADTTLEVGPATRGSALELHIIPPPKLQTRADLPAALSEVIPWLDAAADIVASADTHVASEILQEVQDILETIDQGFRLNQVPAIRVEQIKEKLKAEDVIRAIEKVRKDDPQAPSIELLLEVARRAVNKTEPSAKTPPRAEEERLSA